MLKSILLTSFMFLMDFTWATDPGTFASFFAVQDLYRLDLGLPEVNYDVLTYETELSCGLHWTWCYKVTIWEWDKFSDDKLMSHPTICTNKEVGKIKLRFVSHDFNDELDDIEPYAIIQHNCSEDRQTKQIRWQLPAVDYENQKSFYRHYFEMVVTNRGKESEWETTSLVNYDDSKVFHQSKFQNIHHFGRENEFVHVEPATEKNFSNSSFLMESFKILSKMNFTELISNSEFDKVTDVRNETKSSNATNIFSSMFDIIALVSNKTIVEASNIDKSDDSASNKTSNHWFSHIGEIAAIVSKMKLMDTKNSSITTTTTTTMTPTTTEEPITEKRRKDVFKARKNPRKMKKVEKAPEYEKTDFQNRPASQLNVVH